MQEQRIPKGLCHCGCGAKTKIALRTITVYGHVKGEPLPFLRGHRAPRPLVYFLAKYEVDEATGCWVWTGHIGDQGYGLYSRRKHDSPKRAHRLFYEHHVGPIPEGLDLHHACENRACVNPDHLRALTRAEHMREHRERRAA